MKRSCLFILTILASFSVYSQDDSTAILIDSIENAFTYQHGTIELKGGIGRVTIPAGFKYLDEKQSEHVLVDLWRNPKSDDLTLGLILPEKQGILDDSGYVFNIQYDSIGYVKDKDADDINYDDLLKEMQKETIDENKERVSQGYDSITIVGWAARPFYDKDKKILHWAKELKFGKAEVNTLNYNIRILGRKGVIILNAISTMPNLPLVQRDLDNVLGIVQFADGYKYKDFDEKVDKVALWTIGGLVAGKILAKVGFLALILKFWKIIALSVAGFFAYFKKRLGKKKQVAPESPPDAPAA